MRVSAIVGDLMDRSRLTATFPDVRFVTTPDDCRDADVVVIDLARGASLVAACRAAAPDARIVCFGPHVDTEAMAAATRDGADAVVPRSRFFNDPKGQIIGQG